MGHITIFAWDFEHMSLCRMMHPKMKKKKNVARISAKVIVSESYSKRGH